MNLELLDIEPAFKTHSLLNSVRASLKVLKFENDLFLYKYWAQSEQLAIESANKSPGFSIDILEEIVEPLLTLSTDKDKEVLIRGLNEIPGDICVDLKVYRLIVYLLVRNAVQNLKISNNFAEKKKIVIDVAYICFDHEDLHDYFDGKRKSQ